MPRHKTIIFSIILLAVCYVLATREEVVRRGQTDYYVESKLDVGQGRSIVILRDATPFEIISWCYEIYVNDQVVVPTTGLRGCCNPGEKRAFEILSSRDNTIIGLVSTTQPHILLVAHDFASGASWPRSANAIEWGRRLRDRLEADNPGRKLILSDEARPSDYSP